MDIRKRPRNLNKIMEEKRKIKQPERKNIINELQALKEASIYTEKMIDSKNYKPLSQNSIDKLSSFPQAKCFSDAFIYSIVEKLKLVVENSKNKFATNFQIETLGYYIMIYCNLENNPLEAISLDLSKKPPVLETNTYSTKKIEEYIDYFPQGIQGLENKKNALIGKWQKELMNLKNMELDLRNYEKHIDESYICSDRFEQKPYVSNIDKQEAVISKINAEIKKLEKEIEKRTKEQEQAQYLENVSKNINLDDFVKLIDLLEQTLGINLKSKAFKKSPFIHSEPGVENVETYDIGENNCKLQYVKKVKTFKKI